MWGWVAAWALPPAPPMQVKFTPPPVAETELCYGSGFKLHLTQREDGDLASIAMVVDGGTSAEEAPSTAHLLEHLWFRARPGGGLSIDTMGAGLEQQAFTAPDATTYLTVGSAEDLGMLLALELQRIEDPLVGVEPAMVENEKRIVADELMLRGEHTQQVALGHLGTNLFPEGHAYHGRGARTSDVASLDLEAVRRFAASNYVPANVTLALESPLTLDAMQALAEERLSPLMRGAGKACDHPRAKTAPPMPVSNTLVTVPAAVRQRRVYFGWTLPAGYGPTDLDQRLAVAQLEQVIWRRLPWVAGLKGDSGDASVGCSYVPGRHASQAVCMVEVSDEVSGQHVAKHVMSALPNQWTFSGSDVAQRTRITNALVSAELDRRLATADSADADALHDRAMRHHVVGGFTTLDAELRALFELKPEQLAAVAQRYLTPERAVVVVLEPQPAESTQGIPSVATLAIDGVPPWTPARPTLDLAVRQVGELEVVRSYRGQAPVSRTALHRSGGLRGAPVGIDEVWDNSLVYKNMPAVSLGEVRARTGSVAWDTAGWNRATVHARAGGGSTDLALWQTRVWLDNVDVDTRAVQRILDRRLEDLEEDLSRSPGTQTAARRTAHLFGDDPLGTSWWRWSAAARRVGESQVLKWRKLVDRPAHSTLLLVTPDARADANVDRYLGRWKGKNVEDPPAPALPDPPERAIFAYPWDGLLAEVRVSCRLPGRTAEHDAALDVFEALVGQSLYQSLREGGSSYAPSASVRALTPEVSVLDLHVSVPPDQAGSAVEVLLAAPGVVGAADGTAVRWGQLVALGANARAHASTLGHFYAVSDAIDLGMPVAALQTYPDRVEAVDGKALAALADACTGHEAVTVVGGATESLAPLQPTVVDWKGFAASEARAVR